jgi:hypothetical protein
MAIQYDSENKRQNLQWKRSPFPLAEEVRMSKSQMKTMLITFFDIKVTIHFEFIPQGQTGNQAYYVEILKRLRGSVIRKTEFWPND